MSGPVGYVQCALLYTNSNGERRIRVHTLALPVTAELGDLYRASDGGGAAALLGKLAVEKALMSKLDDTRGALQVGHRVVWEQMRSAHNSEQQPPPKPPSVGSPSLHPLDQTPQAKVVGALKEYRMLVGAAGRAPSALVYPEQLRFLAAYALGLIKSSAFRWAVGGRSGVGARAVAVTGAAAFPGGLLEGGVGRSGCVPSCGARRGKAWDGGDTL